MKYLMVCLGNICRSPMAEGLLRHKLHEIGSRSVVDSCGFEPYHVGDAPDFRAQKAMKAHGMDISNLRARLFRPADFEDFDVILAMDGRNLSDVLGMAKNESQRRKADLIMNLVNPGLSHIVPDPYYGNAEGFEQTFAILEKAIEAVINTYER